MNLDPVSFTIHETGNITGNTWTGTFKARKFLTSRQVLERDRILRSLLGDNPQYSLQIDLAGKVADCQVALVEAEDWWKDKNGGLDLVDDNILEVVHAHVVRIQDEAKATIKKKADEAKAALKSDLAKPEKDEDDE